MSSFVNALFLMSIKTSLLILIILITKSLFNRLFTAKTHYYIWFILFISLTIPYTLININHTFNHFNHNAFINSTYTNSDESYIQGYDADFNENPVPPNVLVKEYSNTLRIKDRIQKTISNDIDISSNAINVMAGIWLFGVLVLSCFICRKMLVFNKVISREKEIVDAKIINLLHLCKRKMGIKKDVKLVETKYFSTPSLAGFYHPMILLPERIVSKFEDDKLELMLLHELAHLKRRDNLMNWVILIYQVLYWFNPVVWIGFYKMKNDMEIACDALVLEQLTKERQLCYGKVIIELLEYFTNHHFAPAGTNILENKDEVKRRIIMIKRYNKKFSKLSIVGVLFIAMIGTMSMVGCNSTVGNSNSSSIGVSEEVTGQMLAEADGYAISLPDAQKIITDKKETIGKDYEYLTEKIGSPYVNTYYIDTKDIVPGEGVNNISNASSEAIYPIKSDQESSALYVFMENDKIVDVKIDEFAGLPGINWKNSDYKVISYTYESGDIEEKKVLNNEEDFDLTKFKKDFLGTSLSDFNNKFQLMHGFTEVINKNKEGEQLSVYPISMDGPGPTAGICVLSKDNIIKNIEIDGAWVATNFERLDEFFSLGDQ